ncbi:hypothetical protein [Xylophilus ampelinus]|uniref:hypothetical protein n=1 Tax=Xylophilus ampelinus TaxID=54067 RepID=UPI00216B04D3|nr:hypothetical protein [Xylophilus ampelinus]MCS4510051.1 hypothetical protein [Xylophilus ampelinus]
MRDISGLPTTFEAVSYGVFTACAMNYRIVRADGSGGSGDGRVVQTDTASALPVSTIGGMPMQRNEVKRSWP